MKSASSSSVLVPTVKVAEVAAPLKPTVIVSAAPNPIFGSAKVVVPVTSDAELISFGVLDAACKAWRAVPWAVSMSFLMLLMPLSAASRVLMPRPMLSRRRDRSVDRFSSPAATK